ncbi:UDP-N-acetylmuramoylalanine--D-glutamate ligase [Nitratiruptor sp. YY08-26]|uniref:UDP-N-acetylmuramoyl-L-alanine--D-glutamate ligase n=1 Tax=unclassified Nitratiruptor TaxID=2624044 RepID=UPI001915BEC3|nr:MULTISPECIES: UDP-N-acetylmuramoyl-L-alanine--D-glutamate ligase [unclassified Nitratiruptor]BCD62868.1 UDP-N-acetylmuramoylalanine--D-glutamate ligase [Nitratiruptor sp. YY08-13]BCD66804.1 UDP-N-acetylmuramoylalanine--D-glutamate ligase [Nitratiruptor sp. YY08-26]
MIALFGAGKTTKAIAKKFKDVVFFEDISHTYKDEEGFFHRPSSDYDPTKFSIAVPSPGIPPSHELIQRAKNLLSEYDLFAATMPFSIWISGTNGKTTTTQMITHLLKKYGAVSGGNIGTPLAELSQNAPIWVLETSSFTLHYTHIAKPNLYVLLPITPDHISWHGSFAKYQAAKLKPLSFLKEGEAAIVPQEFANTPSNGYLIGYENIYELAVFFGIVPEKVRFKGAFLLDAVLALAVSKILFDEIDYAAINSFTIEEHKQEEFYDKLGRLWVNDSKATNIDATLQAVKNYQDRHIHLILGGDNKGVDLEPLIQNLHNVSLYAIGKAAPHILDLAKKHNIEAIEAKTLSNAVKLIKKCHTRQSVAILSPACASLDQFSSYKERGTLFKKEVLS